MLYALQDNYLPPLVYELCWCLSESVQDLERKARFSDVHWILIMTFMRLTLIGVFDEKTYFIGLTCPTSKCRP